MGDPDTPDLSLIGSNLSISDRLIWLSVTPVLAFLANHSPLGSLRSSHLSAEKQQTSAKVVPSLFVAFIPSLV
jgi:hypothetical protein